MSVYKVKSCGNDDFNKSPAMLDSNAEAYVCVSVYAVVLLKSISKSMS